MWFLIYNDKAIFALLFGVVAGLGLGSFTGNAGLSIAFGVGVAAVSDLYMRITGGGGEPALIHPDAGGHVWFIPIWTIGAVGAVIGLLSWLGLFQ